MTEAEWQEQESLNARTVVRQRNGCARIAYGGVRRGERVLGVYATSREAYQAFINASRWMQGKTTADISRLAEMAEDHPEGIAEISATAADAELMAAHGLLVRWLGGRPSGEDCAVLMVVGMNRRRVPGDNCPCGCEGDIERHRIGGAA